MNPDIAVFLFGAAAGAIPFVIILRGIARDLGRSAEGKAYLDAHRRREERATRAMPDMLPPAESAIGTAE
jgi:hypothetical protein